MTNLEQSLLPGEEHLLEDQKLWRQITKHQFDDTTNEIRTDAFGPSNSDRKKPSYSQEALVTAEEAFRWHNLLANSKSKFVAQICVNDSLGVEIPVISDANAPNPGDRAPGHAYLDFRGIDKTTQRTRRKLLWDAARNHGIAYSPPAAVSESEDSRLTLFD